MSVRSIDCVEKICLGVNGLFPSFDCSKDLSQHITRQLLKTRLFLLGPDQPLVADVTANEEPINIDHRRDSPDNLVDEFSHSILDNDNT